MNRKNDNKLDSNPIDLKMATVTRLPAKSPMKSHQNKLLCRDESRVCLGGTMKQKELDRDEDNEKDTNPRKLDLESLPLDMKLAIMTRLSAKSLTKLRCVSKMWYSIIRSRGFIDSFYTMSSKQSRFVVALTNDVGNEPEERLTFFFLFSHDEGEESSSLVPNFEMAMPGLTFNCHFGCCTSSHGFLTVQSDGRRVIYCNPSTEQVIKLPINSRFVGYDPVNDQHKVLSTYSRYPCEPRGHIHPKVLTLGSGEGWRSIIDLPVPYAMLSSSISVCINGFLYYGGRCLTNKDHLFMVCFDVRSEKLSIINAPHAAMQMSFLIDYKGKLASIVRSAFISTCTFDLWILEDPKKHEWSYQTFVFPSSLWDYVGCCRMHFPGTNKAGELIMAPEMLSRKVQPFYIFYYNLETKNIRRVRLLGIGDDEEFWRTYRFDSNDEHHVRVAPQHVESIAFI